MHQPEPTMARLRTWISKLLCRLRAEVAHQRARAELAAATAHELRDIGLSHADALPLGHACCR